MIMGFLVIILPFLGFPASWDKIIFIIIALVIVWIAYNLPVEYKNNKDTRKSLPYIETNKNNESQIPKAVSTGGPIESSAEGKDIINPNTPLGQ